jgi:uncharacterized protein (DUF58 family)
MPATSSHWIDQVRVKFGVDLRPPRRLKFTREGKYFTGMTLLVGFGAINTGNNLLYLLLGMMLALIILSGVLSETTLQKLRVRRRLPAHLFAGRPALVEIKVANDKRRAASYSLQIVDRILSVPAAQRPAVYTLRLDAGTEQSLHYRYSFPRRGRFTIDGVEVATRFPFELFLKSRDLSEASVAVVVFPDPVDPPPLGTRIALLMGDLSRHNVGHGGDYHGLRDHRDGEDARSIHWKTSARRGELTAVEFEEEEARCVSVCLDQRPPDTPTGMEDREHAIRVAAGLCRDLLARGYAVELATLGATIPAGTGPGHLDRILYELALVGETDTTPQEFLVRAGAKCIVVGAHPQSPSVQSGVVLEHLVVTAPDQQGGVD